MAPANGDDGAASDDTNSSAAYSAVLLKIKGLDTGCDVVITDRSSAGFDLIKDALIHCEATLSILPPDGNDYDVIDRRTFRDAHTATIAKKRRPNELHLILSDRQNAVPAEPATEIANTVNLYNDEIEILHYQVQGMKRALTAMAQR